MPTPQPPVVLVKWYEYAKWLLERIENFPKNQRFIFGQRLAGLPMGNRWNWSTEPSSRW